MSELQSVLTRAVGPQADVEVDADEQLLLPGDMLLLCSDGLTRMLTDPEIASTLLTTTSAQAAADRLIEVANENGGVDNVTVIVIRIVPKPENVIGWLKNWKRNSG
jgi:protein phosphatase